jgi:FlaA1/EpsC-like NDP-sugar epimerase
MFTKLLLKRGRLLAISHDVLIIPLAWFGAYWLRFNLDGIPNVALKLAIEAFPTVLIVQTIAYWAVGLYRGIWRFASLPDLMRIFRAVVIGSGFSILMLFFATRLQGLPRSVLPLYSMLLIIFLGGSRFFVRWFKEYQHGRILKKRVLIIGADDAGEGVARDLLRDKERDYIPVAFVDDKVIKIGHEIHGIRVVGKCEDIPWIVKEYQIDLIIIAMPKAKADEMRRIMGYCENTVCPVRTLPGLNDLVSGRINIELLREVSLEDLLGRDTVSLDWAAINIAIQDKTVLVTGGGGSIGAELCRQIAKLQPKRLIVVEHSEYNLFMLEQEFSDCFPHIKLEKHLASITDKSAITQILSQYRPDIIFHAAAYKHVPMLETQPREGILNNILGTRYMAQLAIAHNVKKFILVSTDKAVRPTNVMGATKRSAEMICHSLNGRGLTQFITVRFGNVLGSAGSVVPIFKKQLEKGGPITVTHPEITRFFMTIPEACQLILQSLAIGKGGEIFVLDMGEPIKIKFLAEQMIRFSGKKPGEDIEIHYTGLRPGEKLHEELFHPTELLGATTHEKIFLAKAGELHWPWLRDILDTLEVVCHENEYEDTKLRELLQQLVPEFQTTF